MKRVPRISLAQAAALVKSYLIGHGIAPSSITAVGRGPENPINSNKTFEGRKQNRRVEIKINSED